MGGRPKPLYLTKSDRNSVDERGRCPNLALKLSESSLFKPKQNLWEQEVYRGRSLGVRGADLLILDDERVCVEFSRGKWHPLRTFCSSSCDLLQITFEAWRYCGRHGVWVNDASPARQARLFVDVAYASPCTNRSDLCSILSMAACLKIAMALCTRLKAVVSNVGGSRTYVPWLHAWNIASLIGGGC